MSDPNRLELIEIKLAHLEQAVAALNDVIVRQQRDIDRLSANERLLAQQLKAMEANSSGASAGGFETPPHY